MTIDPLMPQRASSAYADSLSRSTSTQAEGVPATSDAAAAQPTAGTTQPGAIINLSPDAIVLARALAAAQTMPGVRPDRIAAAQARLAGGDKQIDPHQLAGALLAGSNE